MRFSQLQLGFKYAGRSAYLQIGAFLILVSFLLNVSLLPTIIRDVRLERDGVSTRGTVLYKRIASARSRLALAILFARGRGPSYRIDYQFQAGARTIRGRVTMSRARWNQTRVGQPIDVVYLPSDPSVNRAGDPFWRGAGITVPFISLAIDIGALLTLLAGVFDIRRKVRLVVNGVPACALIDEVQIAKGRHGRRYVSRLKYRFAAEDERGPELRHVELRWNIAYGPDDVRQGDMALVLYDAANPARQTLDCFDARRDDRLRLCTGDVSAAASPDAPVADDQDPEPV